MKKYQMIGSIALVVVMSGTAVFAAPVDKDVKAAERDAKKAEREIIIEDKKAEREVIIADKKAEVEAKKVDKVCERVDKTILRLKEQTQKRNDTGMDKIQKRLAQVQERRTVQNKDLDSQRSKRDGQRETFYANLETKAQTDEQTTAIATFKTIVEDAVVVRREAIDDATFVLQVDVDSLTTDKVAAVKKLYTDYQVEYNKIITEVNTTCSDEATTDDLKNIAKDLNTNLKTVNAKFRKDVQAMRQIGPEVQKKVAIRKTSVKTAIDIFKADVDPARADLIKAFGGELGIDDDVDTDDNKNNVEGEKEKLKEEKE